MPPPPPRSTLFPYTTLFRSSVSKVRMPRSQKMTLGLPLAMIYSALMIHRSEEHTSELQSRFDLVCRLLLEKKKLGTVGWDMTMHIEELGGGRMMRRADESRC